MEGRENKTNNLSKKVEHDPRDVERNDNAIKQHIQGSLLQKVEDLVQVFQKNFKITRPYCNVVTVKVPKTELLKIESKKQIVYLEQEFKLEKETDF